MSVYTKINFFKAAVVTALALLAVRSSTAGGFEIFTPYTLVSVPPGETIDYTVQLINNTGQTQNARLSISGLPKTWPISIKSGGWNIKQVAVLAGKEQKLDLKIEVPLDADKGRYQAKLIAANLDVLPLVIEVSEQGTFKSEFTCDQANMEGHAKSAFNFSAKLKNHTSERQTYSLRADVERGWRVIFKPNSKQANAVEIEPNKEARITIEVKPPVGIEAGTYKIPVMARNNSTSAELGLEVVISGTFEVELSTPTGIASTTTTAGSKKKLELLVKNTGSSDLNDLKLSASKPKDWIIEFEPDTLGLIPAGESATALVTIEAEDKSIPGDYVTKLLAKTPEAESSLSMRVSVKTPLLWGWMGIMIILSSVGFVFFLFNKYGRR